MLYIILYYIQLYKLIQFSIIVQLNW